MNERIFCQYQTVDGKRSKPEKVMCTRNNHVKSKTSTHGKESGRSRLATVKLGQGEPALEPGGGLGRSIISLFVILLGHHFHDISCKILF